MSVACVSDQTLIYSPFDHDQFFKKIVKFYLFAVCASDWCRSFFYQNIFVNPDQVKRRFKLSTISCNNVSSIKQHHHDFFLSRILGQSKA